MTESAVTGEIPAECGSPVTELNIVAKDRMFDTDCLAASADQRLRIRFDNEDTVAHNLEIYGITTAGPKTYFKSALFTGPGSTTFEVEALSSGTYFFLCDEHPALMNGTFVVL
jgi:plastocyanin